MRWRVAGVVVWAVLGGIFFVSVQYAPVLGDPAKRPLGTDFVRGLLFALFLLVFGLVRQVMREHRRSQSQKTTAE